MTMKISGGTGITYPDGSVATSAPANFVQVEEPNPDLVQPYMTWADTGNMLLKRRNAANTAWVTLGPLSDFFFARGNILGTVSQSGGVPTGALLEHGSNANGMYWKFAGNLLICRVPDIIVPAMAMGTGTTINVTLPATFANVFYVAVPQIVGQYNGGGAQTDVGNLARNGLHIQSNSGSIVNVVTWAYNHAINTGVRLHLVVFGQWYS